MTHYEITVDGLVGPLVLSELDGFALVQAGPGRSCLSGEVVDQAALRGILNRLQDLRVEILEFHRAEDSGPRD
jgi:hypothetical protein